MEIPLNAQVECTDGICGRSLYVLINPVADRVTHMVVQEAASPNVDRIVPIDLVVKTIAGTIQLRCDKAELGKMDPFVQTTFIEEKVPDRSYSYGGGMYGVGSFYYWPFVTPDRTVRVPVDDLQIPPGELAVRRGARVEATDGFIGHVDEFVVDAVGGHITHMVMREGHLWGQRDVIVPVSAMGAMRGDTVHLKYDKLRVGSLPTFPMHRRWS